MSHRLWAADDAAETGEERQNGSWSVFVTSSVWCWTVLHWSLSSGFTAVTCLQGINALRPHVDELSRSTNNIFNYVNSMSHSLRERQKIVYGECTQRFLFLGLFGLVFHHWLRHFSLWLRQQQSGRWIHWSSGGTTCLHQRNSGHRLPFQHSGPAGECRLSYPTLHRSSSTITTTHLCGLQGVLEKIRLKIQKLEKAIQGQREACKEPCKTKCPVPVVSGESSHSSAATLVFAPSTAWPRVQGRDWPLSHVCCWWKNKCLTGQQVKKTQKHLKVVGWSVRSGWVEYGIVCIVTALVRTLNCRPKILTLIRTNWPTSVCLCVWFRERVWGHLPSWRTRLTDVPDPARLVLPILQSLLWPDLTEWRWGVG